MNPIRAVKACHGYALPPVVAIQIPAKPTTMVCRGSVASARLARATVVNPIAMFIEHEKQSEEAEPQGALRPVNRGATAIAPGAAARPAAGT